MYNCENKKFTLTLFNRIKNVFVPTDKKVQNRNLNFNSGIYVGNDITNDKALTLTAVWCAIRLLAESVSAMPISVYTKQVNGDKLEDVKNPIYNLLKFKPNFYQDKVTFLEYIMLSILTEGNSYIRIIRDNSGTPTQLIPLNPTDVTVVVNNNELFYQMNGSSVLDSSDVLHIKTLTDDGITGISPLQQCAKSLKWSESLEEFGNTFFANGAKPSSILQTDKALSDSALTRLKSSFNNIEMQSQEFLTYTLMPYINRIEAQLNLKLFRSNQLGKTFVEFNVNGLLRGDAKTRSEAYKTAITNGYMSINEVRQKENMNSIDGGDKHFMQMNMTTIEKIGTDADPNTAS